MSSPQSTFLDQRKALACVHCGLCLGSCPTYLETGNENDSPRGRIYLMRAVHEGRMPVDGTALRHIDRCLGCRACETACPSGVEYGVLLEQTRDHLERQAHRSLADRLLRRWVIDRVFPYPNRMRWALMPARWLRAMGAERWLPRRLRDPITLLPSAIEHWVPPEVARTSSAPSRGRLGFVSGCVMTSMFGATNRNTVSLLNRLGYDVVTPKNQGCCGALYAHNGQMDRARQQAALNVAAFEAADVEAIVINAAGCGSTLKEYGHLLKGGAASAWLGEQGERFAERVTDITEFLIREESYRALADLLGEPGPFKAKAEGSPDDGLVTYHDACHLAHAQGVTAPPRRLVQLVAGDRYRVLPESEICCGSAGTYNLTEPELAEALQRRKVRNLLETGAQTVVTTNPGCILQMQAGLHLKQEGGDRVRVVHLVDYLIQALSIDRS